MGRQTSIQLTRAQERQVEELKQMGFGSFTNIARTAIQRMYEYEREVRRMKNPHEALNAMAENAHDASIEAYGQLAGDVPEHEAAEDEATSAAFRILSQGGNYEEAIEAAKQSYQNWAK